MSSQSACWAQPAIMSCFHTRRSFSGNSSLTCGFSSLLCCSFAFETNSDATHWERNAGNQCSTMTMGMVKELVPGYPCSLTPLRENWEMHTLASHSILRIESWQNLRIHRPCGGYAPFPLLPLPPDHCLRFLIHRWISWVLSFSKCPEESKLN